ncbi:MAG: F0F1 ATP synthase subunit B [Paludibacter sp.]|jgi:F-type H+-transporting ATPase subunit b|nr:F0F1 ATP synthase subunit B [Paludibacter sp.]MBP6610754.1 F0F1 ATP synthase subunit B [Paludibacter sp.]MDX9920650.1 F0F1 ATP synthase subunit B [Paludibacter sp.]
MELFTPEVGLIFWMLIPFLIVLFVLTKYGFPIIVKMIEERKNYIDESLLMAQKARIELQQVKAEGDQIIANARKEHQAILTEAAQLRDKLINEARTAALVEADKVITESRKLIQHEKEEALRDIRSQVAEMSVSISEKLMRAKLNENGEQQKMIERLLDEITVSKS